MERHLWVAGMVLIVLTGHLVPGADLPELVLDFSSAGGSRGLSAASGGDGVNRVERVAGRTVRRVAGKSLYFYVRIEDPDYASAAPLDLYVSAVVADDDFNRITLQYDKAAEKPNIGTKYTGAGETALVTGAGGWRSIHFHLPEARVGHGQNHGADFRFCARGLAIARIRVSSVRPPDFRAGGGIDSASLAALRTRRPEGMELTFGNDASPSDAAVYRSLSVTSVESYVDWAGVEPEARGEWDWSRWDRQIRILKEHDLKWVPFLIAGPAYATPLWFHGSDASHYFRCLEHGQDSKVQSLFNPALPRYIDRFLEAFAERYRDGGIIESVLLGITGIYGESIYPAGPQDGWTARLTGVYHNHGGWWAGDDHARAAFRRAMKRKYLSLRQLNQAWGTDLGSFDDISPFLPSDAPSDRARSDCAEWYQKAMEEWAVFWVKTARKHFPETEIYLCTGGNGAPFLGADFTAQAKAIAPYGAGIRITNEASDYAANFTVTREVATATRLYGTFAGFEPAGRVDPKGVVARIYNATASGVRQLHYYSHNVLQSGAALSSFRSYAPMLVPRVPEIRAAFYVSRETWGVDAGVMSRMYAHARMFRDLVDYDMVTRDSVRDGVLDGHRFLLMVESEVLDSDAASAIRSWVRGGGILAVATRKGEMVASRLEDLRSWREGLLAEVMPGLDPSVRCLAGVAPPVWSLHVGTEADGPWLYGDWYHREQGLEWPEIAGARKRWSGARGWLRLPTRPGQDYVLRVEAHVSEASLGGEPNEVRVNGEVVGVFDEAGPHVYAFSVPARVIGEQVLCDLEFRMTTWVPSAHGSSTDSRQLGVALHRITWAAKGADAPPGEARIVSDLDEKAFARCVRRRGRGWTLYLKGLADQTDTVGRILGPVLRDTGRFLPGQAPVAPEDGCLDGIFATRVADGFLRYDSREAVIRGQD